MTRSSTLTAASPAPRGSSVRAHLPALGTRHACAQRAASQPTLGERIARLAASGVRLVVDDLRTDVTKTRSGDGRVVSASRRRPRLGRFGADLSYLLSLLEAGALDAQIGWRGVGSARTRRPMP